VAGESFGAQCMSMPARRTSTTAAVRSYYREILPFYEKEVVARQDLAFWAGVCRRFDARSVLEVGCGLGIVTGVVAARCPVVAFDVSIRMLTRARRRLKRCRRPVRLFAADLRGLTLDRTFDLIVAAGDPFSHWTRISDRRRALRAVAGHLAPEGRFVLDGLYRPGRRTLSIPERPIGRGGRYRVCERWEPASRPGVWIATYEYRRAGSSGPPEAAALLEARAWDPAELRGFFASCGLEVEEVWGGFDRSPWRPASRRVIVVARRRRRGGRR
jgi:SAM-dependent methyltransferase